MANSISSGGGKWAMPAATTGAPKKEAPKSGSRSSVKGGSKTSVTSCTDFSIASSLSARNK